MAELNIKTLKLTIQPHVITGLLNLDENSDMGFAELDRLIKTDQNMATLILKAANSSLYNRGHEIRTLQIAISMLGFKVVRSLALVASSRALFETGNYTRFKKLVWEHSIVTGIIARELALKYKHKPLSEEAFIAGLLHDIGKIVLNLHDRQKFVQTINKAVEEKKPFSVAEQGVFATNHLEAGRLAVEEWKLPRLYMYIVCYHKDVARTDSMDMEEEERTILYYVAYANYLAKKYGYGHASAADQADGTYLEEKLKITDKDREYFETQYIKHLQQDEFYKFFMMLM